MNLFICIAGLAEILLHLIPLTHPVLSEGNLNLDSILSPKIAGFKLNLHRRLEGIRKKRSVQEESEDYQMRVGSLAELDLPYLNHYNLTFWIPVKYQSKNQVLVGTQEGHLILFELDENDDSIGRIAAVSWDEPLASKAMAFSHLNEQWFVVLQSSGNTTWIRLYLRDGRGLERRQSISLQGETDFDIVTVKNLHYLAIVTFRNLPTQPSFVLYHWTKTQFDEIAQRTVYGARSIASWVLDGSLYFCVAQEMSEDGDFAIGSPIYLFNSKDEGELVLRQRVSTYGPKKVLSFSVGGSRYIIFIGRHDAAIYWWTHDQFLLWQTISHTADASDVSILALANGEVVIVIALKEEALFLTLDESGQYVITQTLKLTGFELKLLQFMYSGDAYYALAFFAASLKPHAIYKLTLRPYYIPSELSLDSLRQCLKDVGDMLDERQAEINNVHLDLDRVWIKDKRQNITSEVTVTGVTSSLQPSIVTEVIVLLNYKVLPESSLPEVENAVTRTQSILEVIQQNVTRSVRKSGRQDIEGSKNFANSLIIPSLNMESTNVDVSINGVAVSRVNLYALRRSGDQTFEHNLVVSHIYSNTILSPFLNGVNTDDFLLLEGKQDVFGELKLFNLKAGNLQVDNINTIPVDRLVTTVSSQVIEDLKNISVLLSPTIDVHGQTNGEDLDQLFTKMITKYEEEEMNARCVLNSVVYIRRDIFLTGFINGDVSIDELSTNSVMKSTRQNLKGPFIFLSPSIINEDLIISGLINGVNVSHLVTLSTNQNVRGNMDFNTLNINQDLIVDYVNDFRLHDTAVLKTNDDQFVEGFKIFTEVLVADFIDMTESVTLDGVDPSLLVQDIVKHKEGTVEHNSTVFHNVIVLGNVSILEGVNGRNVSDLPRTVWLKSSKQIINVPVTMMKLSAKDELTVNLVNKLNLINDIVHSYGDETIFSIKNFKHPVSVNTVKGTMINGFDVVSFKMELDNFVDEGTIRGKKVFQHLEIFGSISTGSLNKVQINDIMRPQLYQEIRGEIQLPSVLILINGDFRSDNVEFKTFNSVDLPKYIKNAVLKKNLNLAVKNKLFTNLKGIDLFLSLGSTLDGSSFDDMLSRVVTLNTPQEIISEKIFMKATAFYEPFSAMKLNSDDLSMIIRDIVLKDENSLISSPKLFVGTVHCENIFVEGLVNGLEIDFVNQNTFFKSKDNDITQPMIFIGDIAVGDLVTTQFVDDIQWNDLIFLKQDETLGPIFLPRTILLSDLLITGLLNGCDLIQLGERALYSRNDHQFIREKVNIVTVRIIGNLKLKNVVNGISIEDLEKGLITIAGDQIITSNVRLGPGWKTTHLDLGDVNGINLPFLIKDTVRYSVPQVIDGYKMFYDLETDVLTAEEVFINGRLNGINMDNFYNKAVWKTGHQIIDGEKIFPSFKTNIAAIEGFINDIRMPQDIVLSNTTEHIPGDTYFVSDLMLGSDLNVTGTIDGIDIGSLIKNRVTLKAEQILSSHLYFTKNVAIFGDLSIDGVVNDVVLDLVSKVRHSLPLSGYKIFTTDFAVHGSVLTPAVNGYEMEALDEIILRRNTDEFISDLQVFEKPIKMNSLITDTVNSITIPEMTSAFFSKAREFNETLSHLEDLNFGFHRKLSNEVQAAESRMSLFGYFVLLQEINLGSTTKILNGYRVEGAFSDFSHSMVIWTKQRFCSHMERCCDAEFSHWMKVKKSGHLVIDSEPEAGRFYPLHNPAPATLDKDFVVWTNATNLQSKWCSNRWDEAMFLASYSKTRQFEAILNIKNAPSLSDVKLFRGGNLYAVAGFFYDRREDDYSSAVVYVFRERKWMEHQILPSFGVLSLDLTYYMYDGFRELLLAVGTGIGSYSTIYKWHDEENKFDLLYKIPSRYVTSTLWLKQGSTQLLVMANVEHWPKQGEECMELLSGGRINIYIYERRIKWIQSIPLEGVVSMISFMLEGDTFLVAASSQLQTIFIYEWKGYAGFKEIQSMFVGEVRHISSYTIGNDLYMTVAVASGPSKVLKVVVLGNRFVSTTVKKDQMHPDHQKDEAVNEKFIPGC